MSVVDYQQTAEDHQSFLVLVRQTGNLCLYCIFYKSYILFMYTCTGFFDENVFAFFKCPGFYFDTSFTFSKKHKFLNSTIYGRSPKVNWQEICIYCWPVLTDLVTETFGRCFGTCMQYY